MMDEPPRNRHLLPRRKGCTFLTRLVHQRLVPVAIFMCIEAEFGSTCRCERFFLQTLYCVTRETKFSVFFKFYIFFSMNEYAYEEYGFAWIGFTSVALHDRQLRPRDSLTHTTVHVLASTILASQVVLINLPVIIRASQNSTATYVPSQSTVVTVTSQLLFFATV